MQTDFELNLSTFDVPNRCRVAFLATGDEITTGDIINTNTPKLAEILYEHGYHPEMHLAIYDNEAKIINGLKFLLANHDMVITVGGLGPTEDDCTTAAIAKTLGEELIFNKESWQRIVQRVSRRFDHVPENNKKQAFFPQGATILVNHHGTADGCYLNVPFEGKSRHLFMLPGPPSECFAMFHDAVEPILNSFTQKPATRHSYRWQLLGASEAHVASELKPIADRFGELVGYRAAYPYLEIKLNTLNSNQAEIRRLVGEMEAVMKPHLATSCKHIASDLLCDFFNQGLISISMKKDITKGFIYSALAEKLRFNDAAARFDIQISTHGLNQFWQNSEAQIDEISVMIKLYDRLKNQEFEQEAHTRLSVKGRQTFAFIYEWVCAQILMMLEGELSRE
ncbi:MAG: competence/damage-inducible protein A [Francisellaceae bacterium]